MASGYNSADHGKVYAQDTDETERQNIIKTEVSMSKCLQHYARNICGYYIQIRIVWTDKNGETDRSEWTQPFSVSDISGASDVCND